MSTTVFGLQTKDEMGNSKNMNEYLQRRLEELSNLRPDRNLTLTTLEYHGLSYEHDLTEKQAIDHLTRIYRSRGTQRREDERRRPDWLEFE